MALLVNKQLLLTLPLLGTMLFSQISKSDEPLRAVIPKAESTPNLDGKLDEYKLALCTPIEYAHTNQLNRPAQFYYLWDDKAFYVGVRTLDQKSFAPIDLFWVGDAVEWYFDTRPSSITDRRKWDTGAVHCFFTALYEDKLQPRFCLRPGYEDAIPGIDVKVAAQRYDNGLEYEFALPWANFPDFVPKCGAKLHLDAELSYSDGISRSFRSFVFGGPLSVEQPANLALVKLVDEFKREDWDVCGPIMMPIRVDVSWEQQDNPQVKAVIALPPNRSEEVGDIIFQLCDTQGQILGEYSAEIEECFQPQGDFCRRVAFWPTSLAASGTYHVHAIIFDKQHQELTRVAPRLVSFNLEPGY